MSRCGTCNGSGWRPSFGGRWDDCPCRTWTSRGPAPPDPAPVPETALAQLQAATRARVAKSRERAAARAETSARAKALRRNPVVTLAPKQSIPDLPKPMRRVELWRCQDCPWLDVGGRGEWVCGRLGAGTKPAGFKDWQRDGTVRRGPVPGWCPMQGEDVLVSVTGARS